MRTATAASVYEPVNLLIVLKKNESNKQTDVP